MGAGAGAGAGSGAGSGLGAFARRGTCRCVFGSGGAGQSIIWYRRGACSRSRWTALAASSGRTFARALNDDSANHLFPSSTTSASTLRIVPLKESGSAPNSSTSGQIRTTPWDAKDSRRRSTSMQVT
ncbi:hypothetical protein D7W82_33190 [Corallococcus sp. CA049B]|nr:hypothetical protein D7W82_33190 [Corallococcus sp. CA049B]